MAEERTKRDKALAGWRYQIANADGEVVAESSPAFDSESEAEMMAKYIAKKMGMKAYSIRTWQ